MISSNDNKIVHKPGLANILPVLSKETYNLFGAYLDNIKNSDIEKLLISRQIGRRLYDVLKDSDISKLTIPEFIDAFFKTTKPLVFAESLGQVHGDGSDWTKEEIMLMGRIGRIVEDVTVYAKRSYYPDKSDIFKEDERPKATLLFVDGALMAGCQADLQRVTSMDSSGKLQFDMKKYEKFLEENILPSLLFANQDAGQQGAVVTMPIIGGGQFAGKFADAIKRNYLKAINNILTKHKNALTNIGAIVITGLKESIYKLNSISIYTTPDAIGLSPAHMDEDKLKKIMDPEEFKQLKVYVKIAGDRLSFPANDAYGGSDATHEGGCCMRTNVISIVTHTQGVFDENKMLFVPPQEYKNWEGVCFSNQTSLVFNEILICENGQCQSIAFKPNEKTYQPNYLLADQMDPLFKEVAVYDTVTMGNNNDLRLRATLGEIIRHTSGVNTINPVIVNIDMDGSVSMNVDGKTMNWDLQTGLAMIESYFRPFQDELKNVLNQDPNEKFILIALEELIHEKTGKWCQVKPYFEQNGDFVFTPPHQDPIIGIENLIKLYNLEPNPILAKITEWQDEKNQKFYSDMLDKIHKYIENETWKTTGMFNKIYVTCLAQGGDKNNLPSTIKKHWKSLENYSDLNAKELFLQMKKEALNAAKKTVDDRDPGTSDYYNKYTSQSDVEIFSQFKSQTSGIVSQKKNLNKI